VRKNDNVTSTEPSLRDQEKVARIRLYRSENVGPVTFYQLLNRYQTAERALSMLPELARRGGRQIGLRICTEDQVRREMDLHHKFKAHMVVWGEPYYPCLLSKLGDAPAVLSMKGNAACLSQKGVAVVGARNCSLVGKKIALTLTQELGESRYIIVSGLARGIDTAAHQGSLTTGTVAVIAGGIDQIYPRENEKLYHQIVEQGLLIAESPFGMEPQASLFPRRNRIISGISLGVIIIEAALQSGSLITARYAAEQGKEVFVIPGSPLDPRYKGSNSLLKQGATLVTNAQDVLDELERPYVMPLEHTETPLALDEDQWDFADQDAEKEGSQILNLLSTTAIPLDELIRVCRLSSSQVLANLLQLELAGKIIRHPGNNISRAA